MLFTNKTIRVPIQYSAFCRW